MQLSYKQAVELAEEQALSVLFEGNNYELTKKRIAITIILSFCIKLDT